ncbi:MAG: hypothetical protein WKG00_03205 [Polyangiaceae bacterium]
MRAKRAARREVTDRLLHVAALMAKGEYVRGETAELLAAGWGVAVSTVENYTAEASRLAQLLLEPNAKLLMARMLDMGFDKVEEEIHEGFCEACGRSGMGAEGAARAIAALSDKYGDLTGAKAPKQHRVELKGEDIADAIRALVGMQRIEAMRLLLQVIAQGAPPDRQAEAKQIVEGAVRALGEAVGTKEHAA